MVFEKLEERFILTGRIVAKTPLHIGSGKPEFEPEAVDMPILRDTSNDPYIPGSSIKGKVRSEAEKIARKRNYGNICTPPDVKNMCGGNYEDPAKHCIVCKIFGTAGAKSSVASKVKFRDAYPTQPIPELLRRTGTAINRSSESVQGKALYEIEAVPAGAEFALEIVGENLTDQEKDLLKAALRSMQDAALGGSSTRGFGKIQLDFTKLRIRNAEFYLTGKGEKTLEGEELQKWLRPSGE